MGKKRGLLKIDNFMVARWDSSNNRTVPPWSEMFRMKFGIDCKIFYFTPTPAILEKWPEMYRKPASTTLFDFLKFR